MNNNTTEYWLRGPVDGIAPLLQPIAHALLQAESEICQLMHNFPDDCLWTQPASLASPAFHLQHITGVLSRLLTYAEGKQLSEEQMAYLAMEGKQQEQINKNELLFALSNEVKMAIGYLSRIGEASLKEERWVGRKKIPSTQMGLLVHAAEHTMRHTGQLLVTVKVIEGYH